MPTGFEEFTNELQSRINNTSDLDKMVTLGTLKSILESNVSYKEFYDVSYGDLSGNYSVLLAKDNGQSLVTEISLYDSTSLDAKGIKTDISFSFTDTKGNGFDMIFNNDPSVNALKNFTNLAQAFYESSFSATCRYTNLYRIELSDNLNLQTVQTTILSKIYSKTLDVIYCSGASSTKNMFGEKDFRDFKNVKFNSNLLKPGRCVSEVKEKISNLNRSKYFVVVLQGISQLQEDEFQDLTGVLGEKYAKIIIYDSRLGKFGSRNDILATTSFLTTAPKNVEYIVINKGSPSGAAKEFGMFRGPTFKKYNFSFDEETVKDPGGSDTNNKVITINTNLSNDEYKEILEYYLFSSIIVDIREPLAAP